MRGAVSGACSRRLGVPAAFQPQVMHLRMNRNVGRPFSFRRSRGGMYKLLGLPFDLREWEDISRIGTSADRSQPRNLFTVHRVFRNLHGVLPGVALWPDAMIRRSHSSEPTLVV